MSVSFTNDDVSRLKRKSLSPNNLVYKNSGKGGPRHI